MPIFISSRRKKRDTIIREYPEATHIIDVTSKGELPWIRFSPFYPHGNIPVPFLNDKSESVEGLWQALKVFERSDIDLQKLKISTMKGIKRTVRKNGPVKGHQFEGELLSYIEARKKLYLPAYLWVLINHLQEELAMLREIEHEGIVLLDYETNGNIDDPAKPLSHAHLIRMYLNNSYPSFT